MAGRKEFWKGRSNVICEWMKCWLPELRHGHDNVSSVDAELLCPKRRSEKKCVVQEGRKIKADAMHVQLYEPSSLHVCNISQSPIFA